MDNRGLYNKFIVTRTDGQSAEGGKHHGCTYFVIDVDHDPHAAAALKAYIDAVSPSNPRLAADMRRDLLGVALLNAGGKRP